LSDLAEDEADFLQRHIDALRADALKEDTPRGRFRSGSTLEEEFGALLARDCPRFEQIASGLVDSLAKAMRGTPRALDCVVALVTDGRRDSVPEHVSLLKLDAMIEAAQLEKVRSGIRLRVFRDLLPRPGELQKGLSWPDPRGAISQIIVKDRNFGRTALYFQNAFGVDASPTALETEKAFVNAIAGSLRPTDAAEAMKLIEDGEPTETIMTRIKDHYPELEYDAAELGAGGALSGRLRSQGVKSQKKIFRADGIELRVPLDRLSQVETVECDGRYETRISTSVPLTPITRRVGG
jgi:hypothetical protein